MIDLHLASLTTPAGRLWLAGTERGPFRLGFGAAPVVPSHGALTRNRVLRIHRSAGPLSPAVDWIRRYVAGEPVGAPPACDLADVTTFQASVFGAVRAIVRGSVRTYDDLAHDIGAPRSARAVGRALALNPVPLLVPCHRVVTKEGELAGYVGGVRWKRFLLELESLQVPIDRPRRRRRVR